MKEIDFRYDLLPLKNKLYRLALRITMDTAEAEDVTEDTLIRLWEKREVVAAADSIEAYALTVCRNLSLDRCRSSEKACLSLDSVPAEQADDHNRTPDEELAQTDRLEWIGRLFAQLPEKQRSVMQLRDVEGRSYREIAQVMGMSEEQVKVTLFRARQRIKKNYEKIESHGL